MAKELDLKRLLESLLEWGHLGVPKDAIITSIKDQGFVWDGKEIVNINPLKIEIGKYYVCTQDCYALGDRVLTKDKIYHCIKENIVDGIYVGDCLDCLRPATEEEIPHESEELHNKPESKELTEFEQSVRDVITSELCNNFGDVTFGVSISDDEAKMIVRKLLPVARKQIASELESKVDDMVNADGGMCVHYRQGIEDCIKAIDKGDEV